MVINAVKRLAYLCTTMPALIAAIPEKELSEKSIAGKWSKKEILGHLIDSATNNHQRFIRCQFETNPVIVYDQNKWNHYNSYQNTDGNQIVILWQYYNLHLIEVIKNISVENLQKGCMIGDQLLTLEFLIIDYVEHLEHHLHQIIDY